MKAIFLPFGDYYNCYLDDKAILKYGKLIPSYRYSWSLCSGYDMASHRAVNFAALRRSDILEGYKKTGVQGRGIKGEGLADNEDVRSKILK